MILGDTIMRKEITLNGENYALMDKRIKDILNKDNVDAFIQELIYRISPEPFSTYLKRLIISKAYDELHISKDSDIDAISDGEYRDYILSCATDNAVNTKDYFFYNPSYTLTFSVRNCFTEVKRITRDQVFIIAFALNLNSQETSELIMKGLGEKDFDFRDPAEVCCWWCLDLSENNYETFVALKEYIINDLKFDTEIAESNDTFVFENKSYAINNIDDLKNILSELSNSKLLSSNARKTMRALKILQKNETDPEIREKIQKKYDEVLLEKEKNEAREYSISSRKQYINLNNRLQATVSNSKKSEKIIELENDLLNYEEELRKCNDKEIFKKYKQTADKIAHLEGFVIGEKDNKKIVFNHNVSNELYGHNYNINGHRNSQIIKNPLYDNAVSEIKQGSREVKREHIIVLYFYNYVLENNQNGKWEDYLSDFQTVRELFDDFTEELSSYLYYARFEDFYLSKPVDCFVFLCLLSNDPISVFRRMVNE